MYEATPVPGSTVLPSGEANVNANPGTSGRSPSYLPETMSRWQTVPVDRDRSIRDGLAIPSSRKCVLSLPVMVRYIVSLEITNQVQ